MKWEDWPEMEHYRQQVVEARKQRQSWDEDFVRNHLPKVIRRRLLIVAKGNI